MLIQEPSAAGDRARGSAHFVRWMNDPQVRQYIGRFAPLSMAAEERWFEQQFGDLDTYRFAIDLQDERRWRPIGICGLNAIDWHVRKAPLGIVIGEPEQWGHGYGTLALTLLLRFGFGELNLNRIELEALDDNPRAIRCYEKVGFQREVVRREAGFKAGRYRDLVHLGALREEFRCW